MALGTMTKVDSAQVAQGPVFYDRVTLVGPASYTSGGDTGLGAALRTITKDGRVPFGVSVEDGGGYVVQYDVANDKVLVYEQDAGGALAQTSGNISATTFKLGIWSK